jgi:hypothetical protein
VWIMRVTVRVRWFIQEPDMKKPELNRMTAALRQLTPVQPKIVANELAALDAQPATTVIIERRFASGRRASTASLSASFCTAMPTDYNVIDVGSAVRRSVP